MLSKEYCKNLIKKRKKEYNKIKELHCSCFEETVVFNARGFYHLRYHVNGRERSIKEQIYKLNLFPLAVPVIKKATKVYSQENRNFVTIKRKKEKGQKKKAYYWTLKEIAGRKNVKIKVVLRKVGDGKLHFWSIMKIR